MRMRVYMLVVATAAFAVVSVGVVLAVGEPTEPIPAARHAKLLERFGDQGIDADSDGVLTHEEIKAFFAAKHGHGEARKSGRKEGKHHGMKGCCPGGMKEGMHQGMMGCMEYGKMTNEQRAKMLEHHPAADTDSDGVFSEAEFEAFRVQRMEERRAMVMEHHPEADTDQDGVLSQAEFETFRAQQMTEHRARMLDRHPEADTDGDGTLSEDEMRGFVDEHHGALGCGGAGHGDKEHGGFSHHKDDGHEGCGHHKGKGHAGHAGHEHKEHAGCTKGK